MNTEPNLVARLDTLTEILDRLSFGQRDMVETLGMNTRLLEKLVEAAETPPGQDSRLKALLASIQGTLKQNTALLEKLVQVLAGKGRP